MYQTNLLIIDDSPEIHSLVRAHLGMDAVTIHSAFDAESGLRMAESIHPKLVLMDIDMPGVNGIEAFRRLRTNPATSQSPVAFLTSNCSHTDKFKAFEMGAVDYITKPFDPLELRGRVRSIIRDRQATVQDSKSILLDPATGLFNRRYLDVRLEGELARAKRTGLPLACFMVGIDPPTHGIPEEVDPVWDVQAYQLGRLIRQICRLEDIVCRFSADIVAVLAVSMHESAVRIFAERIIQLVRCFEKIGTDEPTAFSVCIGAALSRLSTGTMLVDESINALTKARCSPSTPVMIGDPLVQFQLTN